MRSQAEIEKEMAQSVINKLSQISKREFNIPWAWHYPANCLGWKLEQTVMGNLRWTRNNAAGLWPSSYGKGLFLPPHFNKGIRTNTERLASEMRLTRYWRDERDLAMGVCPQEAAAMWRAYLYGHPRIYAAALKMVYGDLADPYISPKNRRIRAEATQWAPPALPEYGQPITPDDTSKA